MPRYIQTWDVSTVLTSLRDGSQLNLKRLTQKLIMLLAMVLGQRCSDLVDWPCLATHTHVMVLSCHIWV